jgi:hypothetical protein
MSSPERMTSFMKRKKGKRIARKRRKRNDKE